MRVLGIDPGLNITGYGCVDIVEGKPDPVLVEGGVFRFKDQKSIAYRVTQLFEDLSQVIEELKPNAMAVEKLFAHYRHPRTGVLMGHARGVILLCAERRGMDIHEFAATEVKKSITGNGHASKAQMQHAIMTQCNLKEEPTPHDVADAIGIAMCCGRRLMLEDIESVAHSISAD